MIKKGDYVSYGSEFRAIVVGHPHTVERFDSNGYGGLFVPVAKVLIVHTRRLADSKFIGKEKIANLRSLRRLKA
tara:strand:+ start:1707 stop:1928 length:222 start_codon:yes stop_codon:yes gene_type:complete